MNPSESDSQNPQATPYLVLTIGVVGVSTGALFVRLADAPALVTAAYRLGIALLCLLPFAFWKARAEILSLTPRQSLFGILAGFFLSLHFASWISSLDYTSVANSVVLVNTIPLWVAILTPLVSREKVKAHTWMAILLALIGAVILCGDGFEINQAALRGDGLATAGAFFAAIYILLGRNLRSRLSLLAYATICYGSATFFLWMAVLANGQKTTGFSNETWWAFLGLALLSQLLGHTSYNWALKWVGAGMVAIALLGEPVGAVILAWLFLEETLTWQKALGGAIILYGIYHGSRKPS